MILFLVWEDQKSKANGLELLNKHCSVATLWVIKIENIYFWRLPYNYKTPRIAFWLFTNKPQNIIALIGK